MVGVGASAGGVEALTGLFRDMPIGLGLAFLVVTHTARGRPSALPEILARCGPAKVEIAVAGAPIEPDHIYVASPDHVVTVEGGCIRLLDREDDSQRNPIDVLFGSLAVDQGPASVGILLSGGGHDGTLGLKAIKEHGGLTIAQGSDGTAPAHESMPDSAIAAGVVDLVLPLDQMIGRLGKVAASEPAKLHDAEPALDLRPIHRVLLDQLGHDFSGYKERTIGRRVLRRMQVLELDSVERYADLLRGDPEQVKLLFDDLLIGVTTFFRDAEAFEALARQIVPKLFEGLGADDTVRVWVPGCSTGEEAYSIAMLLREYAANLRTPPRIQLFATDIHEAALAIARIGRYPTPLLEGVSAERRKRWFTEEEATFVVTRELRDLCVFSAHSLIRDPPFSRIDLISCRNLLIYLGSADQAHAVPVFHFALRPQGYLFLGASENLVQYSDLFLSVDRRNRIFQRRDHAVTAISLRSRSAIGNASAELRRGRSPNGPEVASLRRLAEARVVERYSPAHVVVTREGDVVHYSGRTGKYLEAPVGQPSRQLLALARRELRADLLAALKGAAETGSRVVRPPVGVEIDDRVQRIGLAAEPLGDAPGEKLFLVVFQDFGPPFTETEKGEGSKGDEHVQRLGAELLETRSRLQSTIEEYETAVEELKSSNEELQSMNEELQSSNEEHETSKEELQSVNEELHTVNAELLRKIEELNRANADLRNLFDATQLGTVFLDKQLKIRSFTPSATSIFNLIESDRGRPLSDIVAQVDRLGDLTGDLRSVVAGGAAVERRVRRIDGSARYMMRILPYFGPSTRVEGALVIFVDITRLVDAEQQHALIEELNHRVRNMLTIVSAIAMRTLAQSVSLEAFGTAFLGRLQSLGRSYGLVARQQWGEVDLAEILMVPLQPFADEWEGRIQLDGPPVAFTPSAALALGLVTHELTTNAVKYGALAVPTGHVRIAWRMEDGALAIDWEERDGLPVEPKVRQGFGTDLIRRQVTTALDGTVAFELEPTGARVRFRIPADPKKFFVRRAGTPVEVVGS